MGPAETDVVGDIIGAVVDVCEEGCTAISRETEVCPDADVCGV